MDFDKAAIKKLFNKSTEIDHDGTVYVDTIDAALIVEMDDANICLLSMLGRNGKRITMALKNRGVRELLTAIQILAEKICVSPHEPENVKLEHFEEEGQDL